MMGGRARSRRMIRSLWRVEAGETRGAGGEAKLLVDIVLGRWISLDILSHAVNKLAFTGPSIHHQHNPHANQTYRGPSPKISMFITFTTPPQTPATHILGIHKLSNPLFPFHDSSPLRKPGAGQ